MTIPQQTRPDVHERRNRDASRARVELCRDKYRDGKVCESSLDTALDRMLTSVASQLRADMREEAERQAFDRDNQPDRFDMGD